MAKSRITKAEPPIFWITKIRKLYWYILYIYINQINACIHSYTIVIEKTSHWRLAFSVCAFWFSFGWLYVYENKNKCLQLHDAKVLSRMSHVTPWNTLVTLSICHAIHCGHATYAVVTQYTIDGKNELNDQHWALVHA